MPVVTQLARLSDDQVAACARDRDALELLCEGSFLPPADYTNMNWFPNLFDKAAVRAGIDFEHVEAIRQSTAGNRDLHPGYSGLYTTYGPLTYLDSSEAGNVARRLSEIKLSILFEQQVVDIAVAGSDLIDPRKNMVMWFKKLRRFYREAARRKLAVALWLD